MRMHPQTVIRSPSPSSSRPAVRGTRARRAATLLALVLLAAASLAQRAAAQTLIYGLSEKGKLVLNGTVLDLLSSSLDPDKSQNTEQRWWDLAVLGPDRYALRLDGRVAKNGKNLYKLPFVLFAGAPVWSGLSVTAAHVYAVRTDGQLFDNGVDKVNLPENSFFFQRCLGIDPDVYALRSDGAIFKNVTTANALIKFVAGAGIGNAPDGAVYDTLWFTFAEEPVTGDLFALRRDGHLWKQDPAASGTTPFAGTEVADLPFPANNTDPNDITEAHRYQALSFAADGTWHVLRGDGAVFTPASVTTPLIDLPGSAGSDADTYLDLQTTAAGFVAARWDGKVFDHTGGSQLFDMPADRYRNVAVGTEDPDLTNFKNPAPVAARYKTKALEGVAVDVPILVSDIEKLPADLVVTAPDPLPPGATWDDLTRTLSWASPGPVGTYPFTVTADDGVNPPAKFKHTIKVIAADTNLLKNKPPVPSKITTVQALVGFPVSFRILAVDPDGDPVAVTVNLAKPPFTAGAAFDEGTDTFSWTPTFDDIGKVTAVFLVSDGLKTVKLSVAIKVVNPLIF